MDSIPVFLGVGVFLALIAILAYFSYLKRQKRLAAMTALALELGWQFDPNRDSSHDALYSQFDVFRRGHSRYAYNTLHGTLQINGQPCRTRMGDYHYRVTSGSGKSRRTTTYEFSYIVIDLPFMRLPTLFIRPEGIFDSLAGTFGFDDIDFESAEFSKQFHVTSDDKRFAYDVIHPAMIEFLLAAKPPVIDIEAGKCCLTDGTRKWSPEEFRTQMHWAERFFELWPRHLVAVLNTV